MLSTARLARLFQVSTPLRLLACAIDPIEIFNFELSKSLYN